MVDFIVEGPRGTRRISLSGDHVRIGRADDNDISLDDNNASRYHAELRRGDRGWTIEDLGSSNGTTLDDQRVKKARIERGSVIAIGESHITFLGDATADAAAPPATVSGKPAAAEAAAGAPAASTPVMPDFPGYVAERFLGAGPISDAFRVRFEGGAMAEVLRVVRPEWTADPGFETWLDGAVRDWNRVDDPALLRLEGLRSPSGRLALREKLAEKGTLADRIAAEGSLDPREAVEIVRAVASGVAALHRAGLRHGGIHAGKVRLFVEGPPRLSGPARPAAFRLLCDDAHAAHLRCAAPEAFTPDGVEGRRSDVWSLGALLHHAILAAPPGEGRTKELVGRSILKGLRKSPLERKPELLPELSALIESCLAQDPEQRPASAGDLVAALDSLLPRLREKRSGEPRKVVAKDREIGGRNDLPKKPLKHRVLSWSITVFLGLILNGLFYFKCVRPRIDSGQDRDDATWNTSGDRSMSPGDRRREDLRRRFLIDDFASASRLIDEWLRSEPLDANEERELRDMVARRREVRVAELVAAVESALGAARREEAFKGLARLEGILGREDAEYKRLQRAFEGR